MNQRRCAFLTMDCMDGFYAYDYLTLPPLSELGWTVEEIPWRKPDVDWNQYDLVVIRSTWDYQNDPAQFLATLKTIDASSARLENPLEVVRWNLDKTYLKDLATQGIAIVPTLWLDGLTVENLPSLFDHFQTDTIVVKPTVGANADDTYRITKNCTSDAEKQSQDQALAAFANHPLMAQAFLPSIVQQGEYSLFYFAGQYSHSILKVPKTGDFRVQEEHGGTIVAHQPNDDLIALGDDVIQSIGTTLLYARVDLVYLPNGQIAVIEVELIEPSLYFPYDQNSSQRFADAVNQLFSTNEAADNPQP